MFYLFLFQIFLSLNNSTDDFITDVDQLETEYLEVSKKILFNYNMRCSNLCLPSYHACSSVNPTLSCNNDFLLTSCECGGKAFGINMNLTESIVTLTPNELPHQSVNEIICSTEFLKNDFIEISKKYKNVKWQYFGSQNGITRTHPAIIQCAQEDPRSDLFYISATTGFKNIVLIMDFSQSMNFNKKILYFKSALKEIIASLGFFDWIGLVSFSNGNASSYKEKMLRSTLETKKEINSYIDSLQAKGLSNYKEAFLRAFYLMKNFTGDEYGKGACRTHFMFFSDGNPTAGESSFQGLREIIEKLKIEIGINVKISTFNIMKPSAESLLHNLSCFGRGFYYHIPKLSDLKKYALKFFVDITMEITQKGPIWVEPYQDSWGLSWITTTTYPIYDDQSTLLGVLALDFKLESFNVNKTKTKEILKYLSARNEKINIDCNKNEYDECKLNFIRKKPCDFHYECSTTYPSIYNNTCEHFEYEPFFNESIVKLSTYSECCQECILSEEDKTYLKYIYICIALIIVLGIIGMVIYVRIKIKRKLV